MLWDKDEKSLKTGEKSLKTGEKAWKQTKKSEHKFWKISTTKKLLDKRRKLKFAPTNSSMPERAGQDLQERRQNCGSLWVQ